MRAALLIDPQTGTTMNKILTAAALTGLLIGQVVAAPQTFVLDAHHTFPRLAYNHMGLSKQILRFNKSTGTVVLDAQAKEAQVDITIDMESIDTGSDEFDEHIRSADFFDIAKFPTATYKSTKVVFEGDKPVRVEGNLTIKGITKPVTLEITSFFHGDHPRLKKEAIGANATAQIKRSDFDTGKYAPAVSDEVILDIALEAIVE